MFSTTSELLAFFCGGYLNLGCLVPLLLALFVAAVIEIVVRQLRGK